MLLKFNQMYRFYIEKFDVLAIHPHQKLDQMVLISVNRVVGLAFQLQMIQVFQRQTQRPIPSLHLFKNMLYMDSDKRAKSSVRIIGLFLFGEVVDALCERFDLLFHADQQVDGEHKRKAVVEIGQDIFHYVLSNVKSFITFSVLTLMLRMSPIFCPHDLHKSKSPTK